jgi:hypothetical protein
MLRLKAAILTLMIPQILGCGKQETGSVSGSITYDGQPVKSGYVLFTPSDGHGPVAGGPIRDGRYAIENISPGPKIVRVEASSGSGPSVQSSEEMARLSKEWKGKIGSDGIIRTETVPADARGNNQPYEVKVGAQNLDLRLNMPVGKK